jgi:hypothetical protein
MSVFERIKGALSSRRKDDEQPRQRRDDDKSQPPVQVVEHRWVSTPPPPPPFSEKVKRISRKIDAFTKRSFAGGSKKEPRYDPGKPTAYFPASRQKTSDVVAVSTSASKPTTLTSTQPSSQILSKAKEKATAIKEYGTGWVSKAGERVRPAIQRVQSSKTYQELQHQTQKYPAFVEQPKKIKETARKRQAQISATAGQFMGFASGDTSYFKTVGKKQKYGKRISKREAKRLEKLFGENWESKLQTNRQGYYAIPEREDIIKAKRERKLKERVIDFGYGFEQVRTGMEVPLTSGMGDIGGYRDTDPLDIDYKLGIASLSLGVGNITKGKKNKWDINEGFESSMRL